MNREACQLTAVAVVFVSFVGSVLVGELKKAEAFQRCMASPKTCQVAVMRAR